MQKGKQVSYYIKKLDSAQLKYSTVEKELFLIVYILQKIQFVLLGARLTIFIDYKI